MHIILYRNFLETFLNTEKLPVYRLIEKKLERYIKILVSSYHGDEYAQNTVLQFSNTEKLPDYVFNEKTIKKIYKDFSTQLPL